MGSTMSRFAGYWSTRDYCHARPPDRHTESIERGSRKLRLLRPLNRPGCWPKSGARVNLASVSVQPDRPFGMRTASCLVALAGIAAAVAFGAEGSGISDDASAIAAAKRYLKARCTTE